MSATAATLTARTATAAVCSQNPAPVPLTVREADEGEGLHVWRHAVKLSETHLEPFTGIVSAFCMFGCMVAAT